MTTVIPKDRAKLIRIADATVEEVPARILIQVREGVPNVLHEFDLEIAVDESTDISPDDPSYESGGRRRHTARSSSILNGLYGAIIEAASQTASEYDEEESKEFFSWLREMGVWAASEVRRKDRKVKK